MGKRELFIILGFVIVGVLVFQIAAPPAKDGEGFSLSRLWNQARAEMMSDSSSNEFLHTGTIPADGVAEIRFVEIRWGLQVIGEDRADITYEFKVRSTGPTPQKALEYAQASKLVTDLVGPTVSVSTWFPEDGRQTPSLMMRVPKRLAVRLRTVTRPDISDVASVHLDPAIGETRITRVTGALTGTHRSGSLVVTDVGSVKLLVTNSAARFGGVQNGLTLDVRNGGSCAVGESAGALEIENSNGEIMVKQHKGTIRIGGTGGRVSVEGPTDETRIDVRSSEVEVLLSAAVPVIAQTTAEPLRLLLVGPPPVVIEAMTSEGGKVQANEFGLTPEIVDGRQRLDAKFGEAPKTKITLRNLRSDIVIRKGK